MFLILAGCLIGGGLKGWLTPAPTLSQFLAHDLRSKTPGV